MRIRNREPYHHPIYDRILRHWIHHLSVRCHGRYPLLSATPHCTMPALCPYPASPIMPWALVLVVLPIHVYHLAPVSLPLLSRLLAFLGVPSHLYPVSLPPLARQVSAILRVPAGLPGRGTVLPSPLRPHHGWLHRCPAHYHRRAGGERRQGSGTAAGPASGVHHRLLALLQQAIQADGVEHAAAHCS